MNELVFGRDAEVANWVSERLNDIKFGPGHAIGVVRNGEPVCGVVFHGFHRCMETKAPLGIQASIASTDPRWATRDVLRALFAYPFLQLGVKRITTRCDATNDHVIKFNKRLGFRLESVMRYGWSIEKNAMLFRMLKHECRWLGDR